MSEAYTQATEDYLQAADDYLKALTNRDRRLLFDADARLRAAHEALVRLREKP